MRAKASSRHTAKAGQSALTHNKDQPRTYWPLPMSAPRGTLTHHERIHPQHNDRLVERIARKGLPAEMELKENSVVEFTAPNGGTFAGFLRELDATHALFDFNHPMAGKTIRFEVEIIGIM